MLARTAQNIAPVHWHEYIALADDDRSELIDGELIEVEVPDKWRERIVARIAHCLQLWAWANNGGEVLGSGYKVAHFRNACRHAGRTASLRRNLAASGTSRP